MNNRVVITGMGIYSCIGSNLEEVKQSLYEGKSGIVFDEERKEYGFQSALTGKVPTPDLKSFLNRRQRITIGEETEYAYIATMEALQNAGIPLDDFNKREIGIIYGNDSVSKAIIDATDIVREKKDTALVGSGAIFKSMNSTVTMNLSTIFNITGINMTISAACASGSHAIGLGYLMIKNGLQDLVICGGAQEINKYAMASFDGLGVFSAQESNPTKACRPFDAQRDGLVPSGGGATVILESLESALARGATIIAEVVGYGCSADAYHITSPAEDGGGAARAMLNAVSDAGLTPEDITYINAHGTSTHHNDLFETRAIKLAFGEHAYAMKINSTKSMVGHLLGAAGAIELITCVKEMQEGFVHATVGLQETEEELDLDYCKEASKQPIPYALSNSLGFGGHNASILIKQFEE